MPNGSEIHFALGFDSLGGTTVTQTLIFCLRASGRKNLQIVPIIFHYCHISQ